MNATMTMAKDRALLFRRKGIVDLALYVKKRWGTIYGA